MMRDQRVVYRLFLAPLLQLTLSLNLFHAGTTYLLISPLCIGNQHCQRPVGYTIP
ncbi:hypothetical protein GE21DRAFT_1133106 [Neurospora crassa]|nr:hypothetical protein GE21DRAFT_1133106 [Neurospora crassa]